MKPSCTLLGHSYYYSTVNNAMECCQICQQCAQWNVVKFVKYRNVYTVITVQIYVVQDDIVVLPAMKVIIMVRQN